MINLLDLPDEILLIILSHFDHFMFTSELRALCLTSRRLCSIAQPFLYNSFVREVHCQCCHKHGPPPGRIVPLVLFTRTLISRPDLAARVQSAHFDASGDDFDEEDVRKAEFDADTFKVLSTGFQQLQSDIRALLFAEAAEMKSNPYLLVLASRMPNLEHLQLTIAEEGLEDLEPLFPYWWPSGELPYLKNLKSLVLRDLAHTEHDSMDNLDLVLQLPMLEDVTLIYLNGDSASCPSFDIEPGTLNISTLSLLEASISLESLTSLIEGCKCLKEFNYRGRNYYGNNIEDSCQFEPSKLLTILASQKENLRTIRCNLDWDEIHPTQWGKCKKYGSFAPFENLRHLAVDQYPYTADQELPPSLHCLTISNISFSILDTVGSLNMRTINMPRYGLYVELPNFEFLTLVPRDDDPNGMLEVGARWDHLEIWDNREVAEEFNFACETLWDIVKECDFVVTVHYDVWAEYRANPFLARFNRKRTTVVGD
ncbi:uncharacterized protein BDV17DRAFT_296042 [Aspergillus undulatus]|uniref:uncharacterized protein n=1 Tax=Aspergillus undulatus TaxID=1810928 RepID=UPI003CCE1E15